MSLMYAEFQTELNLDRFRFKEDQVGLMAMPDCLHPCDCRLISSLQKLSKNPVGWQLDISSRRLSRPVRAVTRSGLLQEATSESTVWPCLGLKKLGSQSCRVTPMGNNMSWSPVLPM